MVKRVRKSKETGEAFKKLLDEKQFTQYKLEQVTGLNKGLISKIVNGYTAQPQLETLEKIAIALEIQLSELTEIFNQSNTKASDEFAESQTQPQVINELIDYNFIGRETDITHLDKLVKQGKNIIGIYGKGGVGKTTLAKRFIKKLGLPVWEIELPIQPENITPVEAKVKKWLNSDETDFMLMLEDLKSQLKTEPRLIFIDNLETALDGQGKFIASHHRYLELLRTLSDSDVNSITLITSREPLKESKVTVEPLAISGLDEDSWKIFFNHHNIAVDSSSISEMHTAYGGNPTAMRILCGAIKDNPCHGDLESYWKENKGDLLIERDLEDLVASQFNRLEKTDIKAYKLLCRLGCYRYNKIPKQGVICLLWDESNINIRDRCRKKLIDLYLLEVYKDEHYLLEVIAQEAKRRLKELNGDWEKSHREAGIFWSKFVSEFQNSQDFVPKIIVTQAKNNQEQTYINIENAEKSVNNNLTQLEKIVLEIIYHSMEFYHVNSFEELASNPKVADNLFFQCASKMVFEYIEGYKILGVTLYQLGLYTHILALIDKIIYNEKESKKEYEYSQRSFKVSQYFFETALLIANKVNSHKVNDIIACQAGLITISELEIEVNDDCLIIRPAQKLGIGWEKDFAKMAQQHHEVEIEVNDDRLIIRPAQKLRLGWDEAFAKMAEQHDDVLLDNVNTTKWDNYQWEW
ncbi:MAG TPA: helix-turn-helix domain-containing protein [Nostocaceae cyanobacterium]|nr:helix-turn-helix domain-containing protein [Nostocaceae cyanobacterium]